MGVLIGDVSGDGSGEDGDNDNQDGFWRHERGYWLRRVERTALLAVAISLLALVKISLCVEVAS